MATAPRTVVLAMVNALFTSVCPTWRLKSHVGARWHADSAFGRKTKYDLVFGDGIMGIMHVGPQKGQTDLVSSRQIVYEAGEGRPYEDGPSGSQLLHWSIVIRCSIIISLGAFKVINDTTTSLKLQKCNTFTQNRATRLTTSSSDAIVSFRDHAWVPRTAFRRRRWIGSARRSGAS